MTGLTEQQVQENRRKYGENILTPPEKEPVWKQFLEKFKDPLIVILLVAGVLSVGISCYEYFGLHDGLTVFFEPVGIFIAIFLATGLAFLFEYKADKEFSLLNKVSDEEPVKVIRCVGGTSSVMQIARREVVVDDVVMIGTGDEVPADGTLVDSTRLDIDESTLTGEPICHKSVDPSNFDADATFPTNAVMRGTKVMEGHGTMVVDKVGDATENGKVYKAVQIDDSVKTPLNEQLDDLGRLISRVSYVIAALVIIGRLADFLITEPFTMVTFVAYVLQTIMIAVTLIVVAVPEGLPMAVTLSLAYSMRRMLKTHNLVRKMHACETMGAATVICTDKTGTLTQNRMSVAEIFPMDSSVFNKKDPSCSVGHSSLQINMAVNSTAELSKNEVIGNPTEGALLLWLESQGVDYRELRQSVAVVDEIPFSTERKYMQRTVKCSDGTMHVLVKGAPEIVMAMCVMNEEMRHKCQEKLTEWQAKAMRTLALACDGQLQACVAISDPVRDEVPAAIKECLDAGIDVKVVTGDTLGTAREIARQIGLIEDGDLASDVRGMITGPELADMTDEELRECVKALKIIARARPMDKQRLVETLQARGEVVAVTGDGTNDAPALRAAHVGLSMGDGTAVAKEASDITITDNSFSSIGKAVLWGRSLYRNIQRFILFQMTVNVVACLTVLVGAFFDTESPLSVTQMLWVNLIMDTFAAMALASLPPSERVMKERPRNRRAFIISTPMRWFILGVGLLFTMVLLVIYFYFERSGGFTAYDHSLFFTIFVMLQLWNLLNAKSFMTGVSAFSQLSQSKEFLFIFFVIFLGQIAIVQLGGQMFNVVPLSLHDWLVAILATSPVFIVGELVKLIITRKA